MLDDDDDQTLKRKKFNPEMRMMLQRRFFFSSSSLDFEIDDAQIYSRLNSTVLGTKKIFSGSRIMTQLDNTSLTLRGDPY